MKSLKNFLRFVYACKVILPLFWKFAIGRYILVKKAMQFGSNYIYMRILLRLFTV